MRFNILIVTVIIVLSSFAAASATRLNGQMNILDNSESNYNVMLQINTDTDGSKMGGATIVINYDTTYLSFPDYPAAGTDYSFSNFNLGYYDTASVTKIRNGQIWLNIDLASDNHGTLVQKGPDSWTDLVTLNFTSSESVPNSAVSWGFESSFWHIYADDNLTSWEIGNFGSVTLAGEGKGMNSTSYNLSQNYPNPFNPTTMIQYNVPERSFVKLTVYNIIGEQIRVLAEGEKEAGTYSVDFKAQDLPSGVYLYRLQAGEFIQTRKMMLVK